MRGWMLAVTLVACGGEEPGFDPAEVEAIEAEAAMRRPGDLVGSLECRLPGGDVEVDWSCDGLRVVSCTDQQAMVAAYPGGWLWFRQLTGTDNLVAVPGAPLGARVRTVSGQETFALPAIDCTDADLDGYPVGEDCDDTNAAMNPGGTEVCDGFDNDCDPLTDEAGTAATNVGGVWTDVTASLAPGFSFAVGQGVQLNLCAGTWTGALALQDDAAAVVGHPDAASVTLDANGADHAITQTGGGNQFVNGITVTGASNTAIDCDGTALDLRNAVVTGNDGVYAGALLGRSCSVFATDSAFEDNFGFDAGAMYMFGGYVEFRGTRVSANRGNVGGILQVDGVGNYYSSSFQDNVPLNEGRDLWVSSGSINVFESDFGPNGSASDTSAVILRYTLPGGGGYTSAPFGAGTFGGVPVGLGRDFACSTTNGGYSGCGPILP